MSESRRPVEREYLAALNAAVPLATWQAVCERAAIDALNGDAKARAWLGQWLLGTPSAVSQPSLLKLAAEESRGESPSAVADELIAEQRSSDAEQWALTQTLLAVDFAARDLPKPTAIPRRKR